MTLAKTKNLELAITVRDVECFDTAASPPVGVPVSGEEFLGCGHIAVMLDKDWLASKEKTRMYVHPEIMLAVSYLRSKGKMPLYGAIGASKRMCYCCGLFLRYVTCTTGRLKGRTK